MGTHPIFESDFDCLTEIKMVTTSAKSSAEKLTAKAVGREFVRQYYTMLAKEPRFLHRFYGSQSEMMHGNKEQITPAVGQVKIREKIKFLNFKDCHTKVAQLDAFVTIGSGICIQVAGEISNNQEPLRRFMQTFVLGPQERDGAEPGTSFYVHNDIFRYQDDIFDDSVESMQKGYEPVSVAAESVPVVGFTMPQDNGDAAPVGYYQTMTQEPEPDSPALFGSFCFNDTGLPVDVTPTLVPELGQPEPHVHEVAVPEPEVENVEPVEPVQPVEVVQEPVQEEEPLQTQPEVPESSSEWEFFKIKCLNMMPSSLNLDTFRTGKRNRFIITIRNNGLEQRFVETYVALIDKILTMECSNRKCRRKCTLKLKLDDNDFEIGKRGKKNAGYLKQNLNTEDFIKSKWPSFFVLNEAETFKKHF